jgi:hypothetical protein
MSDRQQFDQVMDQMLIQDPPRFGAGHKRAARDAEFDVNRW